MLNPTGPWRPGCIYRKRPAAPCGSGFSLIEVLVVVSVIGLLMAILLPALAQSRENARSVICRSNLKEWGNVHVMYADAHRGTLPFEERPDPRPGQGEDENADRVWDPLYDTATGALIDARGWVCWFDALDRYFSSSQADEGVKICPTVRRADPYREESFRMNSKLADSSKFKRDGMENPFYRPFRRVNTLQRPTQTVLLFDGDIGAGGGDDVPGKKPPSFKGRWRPKQHPDGDDVNYRHNRAANILFTDWHVENMKKKVVKAQSAANEPLIWMPRDMGTWAGGMTPSD